MIPIAVLRILAYTKYTGRKSENSCKSCVPVWRAHVFRYARNYMHDPHSVDVEEAPP